MKRLEISKLMDEYEDNEFFPEGGSTADVEAVKNMVLAKVAPAEKKRRMPRFAQVMLAAALAMGLNLSTAKTWLRRGREMLKTYLRKEGYGYETAGNLQADG